MQKAFAVKLRRMRWNSIDGYYKNEIYRHMVADVLLLGDFTYALLRPERF